MNPPKKVTEEEDGTCSLEIEDTVPTDTGSVTCRAVNCFSETSESADLWVLPPVLEDIPRHHRTPRGSLVPPSAMTQLSIEEPLVMLSEDALMPLAAAVSVGVVDEDMSSSEGRSYLFDEEDEEPHFAAVEEKVTPPLIVSGPRSVTIMRGENILLRAIFVGNPTPIVKWYRGVSNNYFFQFKSRILL